MPNKQKENEKLRNVYEPKRGQLRIHVGTYILWIHLNNDSFPSRNADCDNELRLTAITLMKYKHDLFYVALLRVTALLLEKIIKVPQLRDDLILFFYSTRRK